MKKILILGNGQAGSTIVNAWSKVNKKHVYATINTSENDSKKADNVTNNYLVSSGDCFGMAKERKRVLEAIRDDQTNLMKFLKTLIVENEIKNIILVSSTGGGTGSGLISAICRMFHNKMKLRCILVTPEMTECLTSFKNTLDLIKELQEFNTAIRIVSNEKYEKTTNQLKKLSDINDYIVSTEEAILNAGFQKAEIENIDLAEVETLMFTAGYSPIYRMIADKDDLTFKMLDKINSSLDLPISQDRAIDYLGYIFYSKLEAKEKFSEKELENKIGRPLKKFRAVLPSDKGSEVLVIAAGCSIPDAIQKYQEEYELLSADVRSRQKKAFEVNEIKKEEFIFNTEVEEKQVKKNVEELDWSLMSF